MSVLRSRWSALAAVALVVSACAEPTVAPVSVAGSRGAANRSGHGLPQMIANSQQYRPQTYQHASNRSGAASLSATAMLGKNGQTDLSITSGRAGVSGAAGNISKAQVKLLDNAGVAQQTINYNGTSGSSLQKSYAGRPRHSRIQVQANVRDIDPKRTDVVTITETVNLRPDIAVTDVSAPAQARPATQVMISATLAELNHDLGATANCVLYIDGTEADRANGIWIAEGDAVNCQFMQTFPASGNFTLTVTAEGVVPGDFDLSNNSASRQIQIVNPEVQLAGQAYVNNWDYEYSYRNNGNWRRFSDGAFNNWGSERLDLRHEEQSSVNAWAPGNAGTSAGLTVTLRSVASGATLSTTSGMVGNGYSDWCDYRYDNNGYDWTQVCSYTYYNQVNIQAGHYAGRVIYYSHDFQEYWDPYNGSAYSYSYGPYSNENTWGSVLDLTQGATWDIRLEGENGTIFLASPTVVPTEFYDYDYYYYYNQPYTCTNYDWYDGTQVSCYGQTYRYRSSWGSVGF